VFDVRDPFHKVCAAAGGTYVLIDTGADKHYDGTGLLRVHKPGIPLSPLSDSAGPEFKTNRGKPGMGLTPGLQWKDSTGEWIGLAQFGRNDSNDDRGRTVQQAELKVAEQSKARATFTIRYDLTGDAAHPVAEVYSISAEGAECTAYIEGEPGDLRVAFPALIFDGAADTKVQTSGANLEVERPGGRLVWTVVSPKGVTLALTEPPMATHNGFVQAVAGELHKGVREVKWSLKLSPERSK
jgi:hypothetical protein